MKRVQIQPSIFSRTLNRMKEARHLGWFYELITSIVKSIFCLNSKEQIFFVVEAGIFNGPDIRKLFADLSFLKVLSEFSEFSERETFTNLKLVCNMAFTIYALSLEPPSTPTLQEMRLTACSWTNGFMIAKKLQHHMMS